MQIHEILQFFVLAKKEKKRKKEKKKRPIRDKMEIENTNMRIIK